MSRRTIAALALLVGVATAATAGARTDFDIPFAAGIAIDGDAGDWRGRGLQVGALFDDAHAAPQAPDLAAELWLAWDQRGLLALVEISDDHYSEVGDTLSLWSGDSIEFYLSPSRGSIDIYQVAVAAGVDPAHPAPRHHVHDRRLSAALQGADQPIRVARTAFAGGFRLEALLPIANIGVEAGDGAELAFQIAINDVDADGARHQLFWYPFPGAYADSEQTYRLRLGRAPAAPVRGRAMGDYERFRRVRVRVVADAGLAGQPVEIRDGDQVLGGGTLTGGPGRSECAVRLPLPRDDYGALAVWTDGRRLAPVVLPTLAAGRAEAFAGAELRAEAFVFADTRLPPIDFAQPSLVEDLIGPYTIETTFYDADYRRVESAERPGRYGAIVDISGAEGRADRRFLTLYRQPEPISWWGTQMRADVALPPQLGIDPQVAADQSRVVADYFKWSLAANLADSEDAAIFLAALSELAPGRPAPGWESDPWQKNQRWWHALKRRTGDAALYPHLLHLPAAYDATPERRWPLLVFLHGSGERGDNLDLVKVHGPPKLVHRGQDLPFIVASPQCPLGEGWLPDRIIDLVDSLSVRHRVDPDRVYLTGLSMGGYGTFATAAQFPDRFAAVAPICGGGHAPDARRFAALPTWVFHGAKDTAVPLSQSQVMVDSLTAAGADVRFTVYPEAGHDSWTQTYDNPEFFAWLLSHRRP